MATNRGVLAALLWWCGSCGMHGGALPSGSAGRGAKPEETRALAALRRVEPRSLHVDCGEIETGVAAAMDVHGAAVRAVAPSTVGSAGRITFVYEGPSRKVARLASGELRRQIGLKLLARDTCNVLYVMWHIAPTTGIHVQVKSNPRHATHAQCGDHGYRAVQEVTRRALPPVSVGERHSLAAYVDGARLVVLADEAVAWEGVLGREALDLDGPVGMRSDNGEFSSVELWGIFSR